MVEKLDFKCSVPISNQACCRLPSLWKWLTFCLLIVLASALLLKKPSAFSAARRMKPELLPINYTAPTWDGSYPCLVIHPINPGSVRPAFTSSISRAKPSVRHDSQVNEFEVDLHSGVFLLRQTDLFVPDAMPLSLTRTYRIWDNYSRAFGVGTNHPYDICPTGTRLPYTYMDLNLEDGRKIHFSRISKGTGYADAVFRHDETSSEFYDSHIAWNGDGWTLDFRDGSKFLFPEAYHATKYAQGAPIEMRDERGSSIRFKRDRVRNLEKLISPSGHTITFKYDGAGRIIETGDDVGHIRRYFYNSAGNLETVSDGAHILNRFEYDSRVGPPGYGPYFMTSIKDGNGTELLRNWYGHGGRVSKQRLAGGQVYRYDYLLNKQFEIVETVVTLPSGQTK